MTKDTPRLTVKLLSNTKQYIKTISLSYILCVHLLLSYSAFFSRDLCELDLNYLTSVPHNSLLLI